jgi:hypothetical protein
MRVLFTFLFFAASISATSQISHELDKRNGFKDLKILTSVSGYPGLEYWKADKTKPEHSIYKAKKGSYDKIGNVDVFKVTVYTYRDLIFKIEVITVKDETLFHSLEKAYGKIKSSMAATYSYWEGEKVRLNYETEGSKKIKLTYVSKQIKQMIALDKKKAVESLSTEF